MENSETLEISEILFQVFLFPSFCPIAKIENSELQLSEKIFPSFASFASFRSGRKFGVPCFRVASVLSFVILSYYWRLLN